MEREKWIDFVLEFADKLSEGKYDDAIQMGTDIDQDTLTDSQAAWLAESVTKLRQKRFKENFGI